MDPAVAAGHAMDTGVESTAAVPATDETGMKEEAAVDAENEDNDDEEAEAEGAETGGGSGKDALLSVFVRATSTASRSSGDITKACLLRWMAAVALRLPVPDLLRCTVPCVRLLYRLTTVVLPERECSSDTRALAQEAVELLQAQAGAQAFLQAFNAERGRIGGRKMQRRKERVLQRFMDPSAHAASKAKKQAAKTRQKKRKIAAFKASKGKDGVGLSKHAYATR
jgi:hypothetical protein